MSTLDAGLLAVYLLASYLLGSVPFALVLGKFKGVDIREHGSRNVGATNLTRTLGRRWGIAAFLLDFSKGLLPALGLELGALSVAPLAPIHAAMLAGLAAVLGHVFPVFLRFKGGKGVATTFGVMTAILPLAAVIAGACWGLLFLLSRTVSIASIVAALVFPAAVAILGDRGNSGVYYSELALAGVAAFIIIVRHHGNIRRLLGGKENRFS